jgi:hypothetical protein
MDAPDPLLEAEPDFLAEQYLQAREELINLGVPKDAIVNVLRQAWGANHQVRHEAWAADRERRAQDEPQQNDRPPSDGKAWLSSAPAKLCYQSRFLAPALKPELI